MANEIIIKTQAEYDALKKEYKEHTYIYIKNDVEKWIQIKTTPKNSRVVARENSRVEARNNSSVVARDNSSVVARENSSVVAWGNSSVRAWENSRVVAKGNSNVVAYENSSVEALGNSSVVALGNSSVVAKGNSSVRAWENSSVEAYDFAFVRVFNNNVILYGQSTAKLMGQSFSIIQNSSNSNIAEYFKSSETIDEWFNEEGLKINNDSVVLYKRVSKDFKTQEGKPYETNWPIGETLEYKDWNPSKEECGSGKFHACSTPYLCNEFRDIEGDKYIAIEINKNDLYIWKENRQYQHKIAFRKGKVLYECDKLGKKIGE